MKGELQADGLERIYKSPAPDFELSKIELTSRDNYRSESNSAEIMILLEGDVEVTEGMTSLRLKKGDSIFLEAGARYSMVSNSNTTIYKAITPRL